MSVGHIVALVLEAFLGAYAAYAAYSLFTSTPPAVAKVRAALHYPRWYWILAGVVASVGAISLFAGLAFPLIGAAAALWMIAYFVVAIMTHLIRGDFPGLGFPVVSLLVFVGLAALLASDVTALLNRVGL